ncbi:MAG: hypothetical protein AB7V45_05705 [Candidatus Krumholzibacteriia bacterium]
MNSYRGNGPVKGGGLRGGWLTLGAFVLVLLLALGALIAPRGDRPAPGWNFLVFDPTGSRIRAELVFGPLSRVLAENGEQPLHLEIAANPAEFRDGLARGAAYVLCPDGLAKRWAGDAYLPLAVVRRPAPRNLRPRGVLVYRTGAGLVSEPWRTRPAATVVGDSFSLAATGAWRRPGAVLPPAAGDSALAFGPDPYDHSPVLHALRLGCFDYALVRQWDADRFFQAGLLSPLEWGMEVLTPPVPDVVLLAARRLPAGVRLEAGERLAGLGRRDGAGETDPADARSGLAFLGFAGFNLLIEPDWDLVRRNFPQDWPAASR